VNEQQLPPTYTFYLSGAVGVGKTTALTRFKSLTSFDEWLDPKDPLLHKAADKLTEDEKRKVDQWINKQFRRRNFLISRTDTQLSVVDRSPIDPIAFAASNDLATAKERAIELLDLYGTPLMKGAIAGKVIFMNGNPEVMKRAFTTGTKRVHPNTLGSCRANSRGCGAALSLELERSRPWIWHLRTLLSWSRESFILRITAL
jgi:hypothetical protein